MYNFFDALVKKKHYLYLYYIRKRVYYCKNPRDVIYILKNICFFNNFKSCDDLLSFLIQCFSIFPLSDIELQKFSLWQQESQNEGGLINYSIFTLWVSVIESINDTKRIK